MDIGAGVMSKAELNIEYDSAMKPVSATCTGCREKMPNPPADTVHSADLIMWLSNQYIEHRKLKHSEEIVSSQG